MADFGSDSPGILASLRRLGDTALKLVQNRLELFALELKEEKCRAAEVLVMIAGGIVTGILALLMFTLTIVLVFRENALVVCLIFTVLYLVACFGLLAAVRERLKNRPPPFSGTRDEMKKDREWLSSRD